MVCVNYTVFIQNFVVFSIVDVTLNFPENWKLDSDVCCYSYTILKIITFMGSLSNNRSTHSCHNGCYSNIIQSMVVSQMVRYGHATH